MLILILPVTVLKNWKIRTWKCSPIHCTRVLGGSAAQFSYEIIIKCLKEHKNGTFCISAKANKLRFAHVIAIKTASLQVTLRYYRYYFITRMKFSSTAHLQAQHMRMKSFASNKLKHSEIFKRPSTLRHSRFWQIIAGSRARVAMERRRWVAGTARAAAESIGVLNDARTTVNTSDGACCRGRAAPTVFTKNYLLSCLCLTIATVVSIHPSFIRRPCAPLSLPQNPHPNPRHSSNIHPGAPPSRSYRDPSFGIYRTR